MSAEDFDPEDITNFSVPESMLEQLYEFTGSSTNDRGFCLAYVSQGGQVLVIHKADTQIVDLGLRKALEKYLIDLEESEGRSDLTDLGPPEE
tara:strand:- start:1207 stop:1482 length:276 start_codon:yes stop_codon:yes gene_type:complete